MKKHNKTPEKTAITIPNQDQNEFQKAVTLTPDIQECHQSGLQALGNYSALISVANTSLLDGSVNIDDCTKHLYPQANRWDYAVAYNGKVYFVEIHPAQTSEVKVVLQKLAWLKSWLKTNAPLLEKQSAPKPYYWIMSGKFNIPKTSPQYRTATIAGLKPCSKLDLK